MSDAVNEKNDLNESVKGAISYIEEKQKIRKSVVWGGLAKFVTVLGWIQYAVVWILFFAGVAES